MVNQARFDEVRQQCRSKLVDIADERAKASSKVATCLAEFEGDSGACQEYIDIHDDLDLQWQSTVEDLNRMDWAERILKPVE